MRQVAVYAILAQIVVGATWGKEPSGEQVWIVSLERGETRRAVMQVGFQQSLDVPAPVVFEWEIATESDIGRCTVLMTVLNPAGEQMYGSETELVLRGEGLERGAFTWDSREVPLGELQTRFRLVQASGQELAAETLLITKFSLGEVQISLDDADSAVASLRGHIASLGSDTWISPYIGMRLSIAEDFLAWARSGRLNSMESRHIASYASKTADSIRTRMAFAALAAEESFETSDEDAVLTTIQIENGAFYADGSPVFLAGMILGENELAQVERLARYGLNLAVVERPHTALRPALDQVRDELTPVFDAAKRHNTSVAVQLFMPPDDGGALGANVRPSAVFRLSEPTTRAYSVYLAGRPYAHSLILDTRPRFLFGGESVVESFRRAVERDYLERFALNRHWRTRLASFEDIDIWRGYKRPAYQFDWQVLHRRLGTRHFNRLREAAAEEAPTLLTQVALAGDILTPGESQYAIGHEELARAFPVSGLSAHGSPYGGSYGIEEPGERMLYTLARSFAPGNPVFNSALAPTGNRAIHEPFLFEFIHARVWEGAIEGLSAIALAVPDPRNSGRPSYLDQPEALEGFATANLDINRLLDIVVAFQNAPAKLAILWSGSSKIYEDGEAFLASAANAYSGVSASGLKVRFITETQCRNGELAGIHLLVIPNTPANDDEAMAAIKAYVERGGSIIRAAKPMPYSEKGESRTQELRFGEDTLLVRGTGLASEYLSAMDAALSQGFIVSRPRAINEFGYPLEGVRTRYVEVDGVRYLYVINLRTAPVFAHLFGPFSGGSDLIRGGRISFPGTLQPMRPLLLRLDAPADDAGVELLEVSPPEMNTGREGSSDFARRVEVKPLGANP